MKFLIFLAALLVATGASAADGDSCNALQAKGALQGEYRVDCFYLCNGKDSGDSDCTEFDFQAEPRTGIPEKILIQIHTTTSCSAAYSVDINHGSVSGDTEHDLVTLNASTSAASIGPDVALGRFLMTDLATMTSCATDTFQVLLWTYRKI